MKFRSTRQLFMLVWCCGCLSNSPAAEPTLRTTGVCFRSSYWIMPDPQNYVTTTFPNGRSEIDFGGIGGWFSVLKRINQRMLLEFSMGAVGHIKGASEEDDDHWPYHYDPWWYADNHKDNYDLNAITPILFGIRYSLINPRNPNGIVPYLSGGIGPYFLAEVEIRNDGLVEETITRWSGRGGAYFGGGFDFMMTSWLALNLDAKYHLVDFDSNNPYSNFEWGLGLQFMWGRWR